MSIWKYFGMNGSLLLVAVAAVALTTASSSEYDGSNLATFHPDAESGESATFLDVTDFDNEPLTTWPMMVNGSDLDSNSESDDEDDDGDVSSHIIGGRAAKEREFPYQAHLRPPPGQSGYLCGGTILSNKWVLTAGHCVVISGKVVSPDSIEVLAGSVDARKQPIRVRVERIVPHPQFFLSQNPFKIKNDIALIQVRGNLIPGEITAAANLPQPKQLFIGKTAVASGFGMTSGGNPGSLSQFLRAVNLTVIPDNGCNFGGDIFIPSQMVCVGGTKIANICQGDSGGPLAVPGNTVIGITSFTYVGCGGLSAFTKVSNYITFIRQTMAG